MHLVATTVLLRFRGELLICQDMAVQKVLCTNCDTLCPAFCCLLRMLDSCPVHSCCGAQEYSASYLLDPQYCADSQNSEASFSLNIPGDLGIAHELLNFRWKDALEAPNCSLMPLVICDTVALDATPVLSQPCKDKDRGETSHVMTPTDSQVPKKVWVSGWHK